MRDAGLPLTSNLLEAAVLGGSHDLADESLVLAGREPAFRSHGYAGMTPFRMTIGAWDDRHDRAARSPADEGVRMHR